MKKKSKSEIREEEFKKMKKKLKIYENPTPFFKKDIEQMLKEVPLKKVRKAKKLWNEHCK